MNITTRILIGLATIGALLTSCKHPDPLVEMDQRIQNAFQDSDKAVRVAIGNNRLISYTFIHHQGIWTGYVTSFLPIIENNELVVASIQEVKPRQGWEEFDLLLNHLQILQLPDQSEVVNYPAAEAGDLGLTYMFRVKHNGELRYYRYDNPETVLLDSWQAQSVAIFGSYVMGEFIPVE